jgi:hypothetical protein
LGAISGSANLNDWGTKNSDGTVSIDKNGI